MANSIEASSNWNAVKAKILDWHTNAYKTFVTYEGKLTGNES